MAGEPAIDLDQPRTTKCSPKDTIAVAVVEIPAVAKIQIFGNRDIDGLLTEARLFHLFCRVRNPVEPTLGPTMCNAPVGGGVNGTKAAIAAGFSRKNARSAASTFLTKPNIQ